MNKHPHLISRYELAGAHRQRGVVLLVIMLVTLTFGGYFGVRALNASSARSGIDEADAQQILAQSKAALLAWSVTPEDLLESDSATFADPYGIRAFRPGNLPYPDLAQALTNTTPSDGIRDRGCAFATWAGTGTLRAVHSGLSTARKTALRCFGRLPLNSLGLDNFGGDTADTSGKWPWYIVSANLVAVNYGCPDRLDATIVGSGLPSGVTNCGDINTPTVPFPWITVLDPFGATVTTRGAAVIILPGPITARQPGTVAQTRSATALPTAFLDTVDNASCTGGRCDNGGINQSPNMTFIQCVSAASTVGDARFNANYTCNDRLTYITIDELMSAAAKRIEREFVACLKQYAGNNGGKYPWAALSNNPSSVTVGQLTGSFPSNDASATATCANQSGYWGGWQRAATYTVAANQLSASIAFASLPRRAAVTVP